MLQYNQKTATRVWVEKLCCSKEASAHTGLKTEETGVVLGAEGLDIRTVGEDLVFRRVNF